MIYCNVKGGLGNMMFQIAATKSISLEKNTECSFPNLDGYLNFLNHEMNHNPSLRHSEEYLQIFKKINRSRPQNIIPTINYPFHYTKIDLPENDCFIDGFFQSEKYFVNHRKEILDLFEIPISVNEMISKKYSHLLNQKTTSIHIRRGDYLKYPNHHPTQHIDYYLNSIDLLKEMTDLFIVFSDDIEWCEQNLPKDNFYYIKNEKDYVELYLMSMCNNNITCNSSFSWWGAWLNKKEDKKVIGPKIWFGSAINHNTDDIIPQSWIKL